MADCVKHKSRSKERSRSRTATNKKKKSKRSSSTSSSSSGTSSLNISIKRKSTSCSKDKRKKSRRYSSSTSSSRSSSSSSSSSSSPRKDTRDIRKENVEHSVFKSHEKRVSQASREVSRCKERKTNDDRPSISRSKSAKQNDDRAKPSSYYQKTEFYCREQRKDWRSGRERCTIRSRDYRYANAQNSLGMRSTEVFRDHRRSRTRNEREASRGNERRNSMSMNDEGSNRAVKKIEDCRLSSRNNEQDSREPSILSGKNKAKKSKRRRKSSSSSSSSSNSGSSTSSSSDETKAERKRKKRKKIAAKKLKKAEKRERKREKKLKKKLKKSGKEKLAIPIEVKKVVDLDQSSSNDRLLEDISAQVIERAKCMAPMTKEQWEKKQSVIRRVYDEETGRHRLIKGGGEVLEEIVSRDRHREINRQATRGDGEYFQSQLRLAK